MKIIGKTRDDAAGEAFDKAARTMGMPYPGGIEMDRVAENGNPFAFKLPRPAVHDAPYDFSFSGLKTAVINLIHNSAQRVLSLTKPMSVHHSAMLLSIALLQTLSRRLKTWDRKSL